MLIDIVIKKRRAMSHHVGGGLGKCAVTNLLSIHICLELQLAVVGLQVCHLRQLDMTRWGRQGGELRSMLSMHSVLSMLSMRHLWQPCKGLLHLCTVPLFASASRARINGSC